MPRKVNPKSLANLKAGSASKGGKIQKRLTLLPQTIALAEAMGSHGKHPSASDGIDKLFAKLPVFARCKILLSAIAENPGSATQFADQIEAVLIDLEGLEIDQAYKEAIAEGVIKTPSGSWIV